MDDQPVSLTPRERALYTARLERLIAIERPQAEERLRTAELLGDDDDEDEYDNAVDDHADILTGIKNLPRFLAQSPSISADEARKAGLVRLGSRVGVRRDDGTDATYQIDGPYEIDWTAGQPVTSLSPIGRALMSNGVGAVVVVEGVHEPFRLEIVRVDQHPDR